MFLKENAVNHEIYHKYFNMRINLVAALNGYKTYQSNISYIKRTEINEMIYIDSKSFCSTIFEKMKESGFIN